MKLSLATALVLSAATAPASTAYQVGGYSRFAASPRQVNRAARRCAPQQQQQGQGNNDCVNNLDRAFEDLAAELNANANSNANANREFRARQDTRRAPNRAPGPSLQGRRMRPFNPWEPGMSMQLDAQTIEQQKEFLNRAFGLAEDVAKSVATSPRQAKEADDAIRQSKEFANRVYGFATGTRGSAVDGAHKNYPSSSSMRSEILQNDKELFEVALDVPGVKEANLEVTVEGTKDKTLLVTGKRNVGKDVDGVVQTKDFSEAFPLDPNLDVEQMKASLDNGVLIVSVPRLVVETTASTQKIPVTQISGDSQTDKSEADDQPFQLELDVPGVQDSNIDIAVSTNSGDSGKTLTISAVREMGKDADGSPRTKELSKSFQINELVDVNKIVATLDNGVLTVSAPVDEKKAETSIKKIVVNKSTDTKESPPVDSNIENAAKSGAGEVEEASEEI